MKHLAIPTAAALLLGMAPPSEAASLELRAGIIKGDGSVRPVARTLFTLTPSAGIASKEEYLAIAKEAGISEPDPNAYYVKTLSFDGLVTRYEAQPERYEAAIRDFYGKIVAHKSPGDRRKHLTVRTNLAGTAKIDEISPGEWEVFGVYEDNFTSLAWSRRFVLKDGRNEIELANDNSESNFWPIQVPELEARAPELTPEGRRYAEKAQQIIQELDAKFRQREQRDSRNRLLATLTPLTLTAVGFLLPMETKSINNDARYSYQVASAPASALVLSGVGLSVLGFGVTTFASDWLFPKPSLLPKDGQGRPILSKSSGDLASEIRFLDSREAVNLVESLKSDYPAFDAYLQGR